MPEEEKEREEEDDGSNMELSVLQTELSNQEHDQTMVSRQEEFAEVDRGTEEIEEEMKDKKV